MYSAISKYCTGNILEIGSGIGNISEIFLKNKHELTVSDIRANYRSFLASKFPNLASSGKIIDLDLVHPDFVNQYAAILNSFDTVFALNVVEHIEDDRLAIANCIHLLKPGGKLIILVPAFQSLYNQFDKELYHFRRYTRPKLEDLFNQNHLDIKRSFYFNAAGIPAWFISGKMQKHKTIPGGQMKFFKIMVPIFKLADILLMHKVGLSVVCVGSKKT